MSIKTRSKYPSSPDAEKGLLGSILLSPKVLDLCDEMGVTEDWFYPPAIHPPIYEALLEMRKLDKPVDLISVSQFLEDTKRLEGVGGAAYVTELFSFTPTASNAKYYIQVLHEKYVLRSAIMEAEEAQRALRESTSVLEAHAIATGAFKKTLELCQDKETTDYHHDAMDAFLESMEKIAMGEAKPDLFPTGLPTIDHEAGGMTRGELILIRGIRGAGKSLLGQAFIQQNVLEGNRKGAIITLEMPHAQFMRRLIASDGRVPLKSMKEGKYNKGELDRFAASFNRIKESGLKIYDVFHLKRPTAPVIFAKIREVHRKFGLDIVLIDHLHRLQHKGNDKRTDEILNEFSREFKNLCLELQMVGILLAQENDKGGTFGSTQVETDVDGSLSLVPIRKKIGGVDRVMGTSSAFCDKWREGDLLGKNIPLTMEGHIARLYENTQ